MGSVLRSVLVVHPGGLGDVLLAVPALQAIRSRYPKHELVLLAGTEVGRLLQACGIIDRILSIEAGHLATLFAGPQQFSAQVEKLITRCDLAVAWLSDSDGSLQAALQSRGISRIIVQQPERGTACHQSDRFLASVQDLPVAHDEGSLRLNLPEPFCEGGLAELKGAGLEKGAPYVVCHPGSGSPHKCIRPDILVDILTGCGERALAPVIAVGPADEQALQALDKEGLSGVPVVRPQSLVTLAGILARASAYIGHDSGVTHLAALLGIPTLAMFGPTDPCRWAPRGAHISVVTGAACSCNGWDAVRACREKPCLQVPATEVFPALDRLLSRYRQVTNS
ncbi:glycosyltransferase family 9 protein [Nitrospira sp. NS4]|uniref:glycosyltransferase family 9 protein n=1 Tax=Nitrospira sp. NS4 TaxID=3414498 RepID=UPI003C2BC2FA